MTDRWILTPQFFETPEGALASAVPEGAAVNAHDVPDRGAESLGAIYRPIRDFVTETLKAGDRPISMAGDCCASIPVMAGITRAGITPSFVWIDAHGDFNTPETSPSQFLGGMPLAMMVGRGPQWLCETVSLAPIPEDSIWLIDGRDLDPGERAAIDASALRRTGMAGLATLRLDGPIYVHLDVDVLSADEVPGFNYPVSGGPGVAETVAACSAFAAANDIMAISISGWSGALDPDGRTGAACRRVITALTG